MDNPSSAGGPDERLEALLRRAGRHFPYPPPAGPAAARVRGRPRARLAWALAGLAALGLLSLAVPQVRAGLVEFIQIGVVRVFVAPPTAAPATVTPAPTLLPSLLDLAGHTTLEAARQAVAFPIRLPAYPADLGPPDDVFLQDLDGSAVVLVWRDHARPDQVRLSLHYLSSPAVGVKGQPEALQSTAVNGQSAVWTTGGYVIQVKSGNWDFRRLIDGHVLVWTEGALTLRLETDLPLAEAVRVAESLR
ncbi:MAG: hypothetical protein JNK29_05355 [Anaerolineales bacterium]|nr:hypothetical protein [Anaerolineales bacterium]